MKKNLFLVVNAIDAGSYVLFRLKDVKFLQNIRILDVDVVHTGKRIKDLFVLASTVSYVDKMSTNDGASIWHAKLGHLSMDKLKAMALKNLVKGLLMSVKYCLYGPLKLMYVKLLALLFSNFLLVLVFYYAAGHCHNSVV
jgi:hypothetical protein